MLCMVLKNLMRRRLARNQSSNAMTDALSQLTDEEANVRLAECLGWRFVSDGTYLSILNNGHYQGGASSYESDQLKVAMENACVPPYCQSLDTCATVEAGLTIDQSTAYSNLLWPMGYAVFSAITASARQRCIALIATLSAPNTQSHE